MHRNVASKALAELMSVLSHPDRIRIVEELRGEERDVGTVAELLGSTVVRISQHLSVMRSHRIVTERREGRRVFYRLTTPGLAQWLLEGLRFVEPDTRQAQELRNAVESAVAQWSQRPDDPSQPPVPPDVAPAP